MEQMWNGIKERSDYVFGRSVCTFLGSMPRPVQILLPGVTLFPPLTS